MVRGAMGNLGKQIIEKAGAMCNCFPQVLGMLGDELFKTVENGVDLSAAVSTMIKNVIKLQKVMIL